MVLSSVAKPWNFVVETSWKPAMILDPAGEQGSSWRKLDCFEPESETEAYYSCSITWTNKLYIFGGHIDQRQISRLDGYHLKRIGTLDFDHYLGGCTVMNDESIYLCFGSGLGVFLIVILPCPN